ncbi:MAG TPA: amidohydrolase family protein, partial [Rectinemataceae bacterium]
MLMRNLLAALPGEDDFKRVDILVQGEKIVSVRASASGSRAVAKVGADGRSSPGDRHVGEELDGSGLLAFPGAIDPHVHFDEPGFTHREDFLHGTAEAARGGVTTVIDMPCTSLPPVTCLSALEGKLGTVSGKALVDYAFFGGFHGAMEPKSMAEAAMELAPRVVGFKCYAISGMESFPALGWEGFGRALDLCSALGRPLLLHAEDPEIIRAAQERLEKARGSSPPRWKDYYASRPMEAEIEACRKAIRARPEANAWLHVVHVGTAEAVRLAKAGGASVETCAHYLAFDESDFDRLGSALKTAPPVKEASQKALLWRLLAEGTIDYVASDHAGAPDYEKYTGDPLTAYGGIPGTGTLFPYLLSQGLFAKRLGLGRFLEATCQRAARRYGLDAAKGRIEPGFDADLVLVDPDAVTLLGSGSMFSKSAISPFSGMRLAGSVAGTFVRGACAFARPRLLAGAPPLLRAAFEASPFEEGTRNWA